MTNTNLRRFEGKVALVTSASSGVGKATALAFASEGAHVAILDASHREGEAFLTELQRLSPRSIFLPCDVTSHAAVRAAISLTIRRVDRLDCAFNNARIENKSAMLVDIDEEDFDHSIDVNLKSVWLCMKYELVQMWQQGNGSIVNCASAAGLIGVAQASAHVAGQHGILGLTKSAALEVTRAKIRVNAVCPTAIQTTMNDAAVADAVLWLCSDGASLVTGQSIAVDG